MSNDIENFKIEEHLLDDAFNVSLAGVMPENETVEFCISDNGTTDTGECFSVEKAVEEYSFIDGCEQLINQLYLVVKSVAEVVLDVITRKYKMYCERAKVTVLDCTPNFLRL